MKRLIEDWNWALDNHLGRLLICLVILVGAFFMTRLTRAVLRKLLDKNIEEMRADPTQVRFLKNSVAALIYLMAFVLILYIIPGGKTLAVSLFAGAGILAAVIGFASQAAFSNIISGVFIVIFKPFRVGDWIEVGSLRRGVVEDITLRHTVIRNFEHRMIIIPNSVISSETVTNSSIRDPKICRHVEISISYDSDVDLAMQIMREEAMKHPLFIDNRDAEELAAGEDAVVVRLISFGDSSMLLRAYVWAADARNSFVLHTDLNVAIKKRFDREGIEIPFPYRTVVFKKDLPQNAKSKQTEDEGRMRFINQNNRPPAERGKGDEEIT